MSLRPHSPMSALCPSLGHGVGLRLPHYGHVLETLPTEVDWFEAVSENFIGLSNASGGRPLHVLEEVRKHYPVVLHGVSLSIGSVDPIDRSYLAKLRELYDRIEPAWVSDHLCWTGVGGENLHDLLPLPYTEEALAHVVAKLGAVQDFLGRRLLIENVSSYLTFEHSEMTEWEFLVEVARRADCGILLDINNIYVSSRNHGFDPMTYLEAIPPDRVGQFHLAGHSDNGDHLVDTHDHPVAGPVWSLYAQALRRFGNVSTLLEWDDRIPEFEGLVAELGKARRVAADILGESHGERRRSADRGPQPWGAAAVDGMDHH